MVADLEIGNGIGSLGNNYGGGFGSRGIHRIPLRDEVARGLSNGDPDDIWAISEGFARNSDCINGRINRTETKS